MAIDLPAELAHLRRAILTMGASVEQRLREAGEAVLERDLVAARAVRAGDDEIDRMEIDIDEECLRILALSHPVAGDLRLVLGVMRINSNLERIGDMARGIAKRAIDLDRFELLETPPPLADMVQRTCDMFSEVLTALADADTALARRVREADERVDDLQKEMFAWAREAIPQNVERLDAAIDLLSVARKLERIADHCTNMAEDVIFLTEGAMVRHEH